MVQCRAPKEGQKHIHDYILSVFHPTFSKEKLNA
jgi:hypothetical protein